MTDPNAPSTEQASHLQAVSMVQLRLRSFWPQNPQVWFVVPPDVTSELPDVLSSPSDTTPYQHLKTKVAYSSRVLSTDHAVNHGIIVDIAEGFTGNSEKICEALNWEPLTPTAAESDMCPATGFTDVKDLFYNILRKETVRAVEDAIDLFGISKFQDLYKCSVVGFLDLLDYYLH
ncbi:hypothetical protein HPB52_012303 [Rhipicephalus sanguineus]|uniref:Uncharacterized protein n=1 Tax=Rhipicephalus sanguineus TaxID=34632 RepID=A0A9D4T9R6_RHISA|nr:hypothetical protein HPB52_012303 [Rhipicephalus sanguineus]